MENIHGKEIFLQYVTVKIPGQKPRGSQTVTPGLDQKARELSALAIESSEIDNNTRDSISSSNPVDQAQNSTDTPNSKSRMRRMMSNGIKSIHDNESRGKNICDNFVK